MLSFEVTDHLRERFFNKVAKQDGGCWEWTGGSRYATGHSYGTFKIGGRAYDTHRVSFVIHNGPIPDGSLVCHTCDNRRCVNPAHLFLGTYRSNHMDAIEKGRITPFKQTRTTRLTAEERAELLADYSGGVSERALAAKFKLAPTSLKRIIRTANQK